MKHLSKISSQMCDSRLIGLKSTNHGCYLNSHSDLSSNPTNCDIGLSSQSCIDGQRSASFSAANNSNQPRPTTLPTVLNRQNRRPGLKIMQWNACSLNKRTPELKKYLESSHIQPDILCIQETLLKSNKRIDLVVMI
jgi:hypothetical protein